MNRIYCPIENGWAERINRARKSHKCIRCHHTISEGSSYVCLHVSKTTYAWESNAMCNDCYVEAFEKAFGYMTPVKALPEGVEAVYRTSDGEVFSTINDAERHIQIQKGKEYCLMYNDRGERTAKVEDCIVLKILSDDGIRYFIDACKRYMAEHPHARDVSGGLIDDYTEDPDFPNLYETIRPLYLWNDDKYILIDDDQCKAFMGYIVDTYNVKK